MGNNRIKLTEKELIELTIKYGHDGSELKNKHYIDKGYLKNRSNSHKSFLEKVQSICETYQRLNKKRNETEVYYYIYGLKEAISDYTGGKGGYKKKKALLFKDIILSRLKDIEKDLKDNSEEYNSKHPMNYTYSSWAYKLGFPYEFDKEKLEYAMDFLNRFFTIKQVDLIIEEFKKRRALRSRAIVEQVFKKLQQEKKINITECYYGRTWERKHERIEECEFIELNEKLKKLLEFYNVSPTKWNLMHDSKQVEKVKSEFYNDTGFLYIGKSYHISLLTKETVFNEDNQDDFINLYYDNLLEYADSYKQKENGKKKTPFKIFFKPMMSILSSLLKENSSCVSVENVLIHYKDAIEEFIRFKHDGQMKSILTKHIREHYNNSNPFETVKYIESLEDLSPQGKKRHLKNSMNIIASYIIKIKH